MVKLNKITIAYSLIAIYVIVNTILIGNNFYYLSFLPLAIGVVLLAFYSLDRYLLLIVFFTPLSVPLLTFKLNLNFDMWIPSEPMLAGLLLIFFIKLIKGERPDKNILLHPVTLAIYFNLIWILVTAFTSSMFIVSIKFFFARVWFVAAFYFIAAEVFKTEKNINKYIWYFIIPLLGVITYSIIRHAHIGFFQQRASQSVMTPFFMDHTSYGAVLAMMIPVIGGFIFNSSIKVFFRIAAGLVLIILTIAIVLSYTRAAWVSVFVAIGVMFILIFKIRFNIIMVISILAVVFIYSKREIISQGLEKNRQETSANLTEHVKSMSNITSDDSNLERINRWNSALRMFNERPVFGWGPGTYMFNYAPFQLTREKTLISTNAADRGNAHSEYLGPLAESGLFGMLTFLFIIISTIVTAVKVYSKAEDRNMRILITSLLMGLVTYYVHGVLNNFLDTDKASALFWGFTAMIVAIDRFYPVERRNTE